MLVMEWKKTKFVVDCLKRLVSEIEAGRTEVYSLDITGVEDELQFVRAGDQVFVEDRAPAMRTLTVSFKPKT